MSNQNSNNFFYGFFTTAFIFWIISIIYLSILVWGGEIWICFSIIFTLREINHAAFQNTYSLESIVIPASVQSISNYIKKDNNRLKDIFFAGSSTTIDNWDDHQWLKNVTIHAKGGSAALKYAIDNGLKYQII